MNLLRTYRSIIRGGTDRSKDRVFNNKVAMINVIIMVAIPAQIFFSLLYFFIGNFQSGVFALIASVIYGVSFIFNQNGEINRSRFLTLYTALILITYVDLSMGGQTGVHLFLYTVTIAVFLFYDLREWIIIIFYMVSILAAHVLIFTFPEVYSNPIILSNKNQDLIELILYFGNLSIIILLVMVVSNYNNELSHKLTDLIRKYRDLNRQNKERATHVEDTNQQLRDFIKNKDRFIGLVSSEIKDPISGIASLAEELHKEGGGMSHKDLFEISIALKLSSNQVLRIADNFLQWANIISGKSAPMKEDINLYGFLRKILNKYDKTFEEKKIEVKLDVNIDSTISADSRMLGFIIENILQNATDFGRALSTVSIKHEHKASFDLIIIEDSFFNMKLETLQRLIGYDSFGTEFGSDFEKGSRLGFIVSKKFLEMQDGRILIEQFGENGIRFILYLKK